jgi:DNA-binding transcriptional LysR family regulator
MILDGLSTDALSSFAVFADHLNFTRAAAELHISQPALHVKVRKLAEGLGRPLYRREGRRLALTSEGELVARFAREQDDRLAALLADLGAGVPRRPVVLAAGSGAYLYLLGDAIRAMLTGGAARLRLMNCHRAQMLAAVRTGRAHLGVAVLDVLPDDLDAVLLARFPQTLVMPQDHPLARRRSLTVRDLAGAVLVVPPPDRPHRITLERALLGAEVSWSIAVEAEGWPLILRFVALGAGLAVVNGCVEPPPELVSRPITDLPAVPYYAVHRPGALADPRVNELLDTIRTRLP